MVASGNGSSSEGVSFPGCVSTAVTVSSSGGQPRNEWISSFANFSPLVDLVAPGELIVSSIPGGGYEALSGTSMAAPHVAGAWAVLRSKSPDATVDQIERVLVSAGTMVHDIYANNLAKPRIELAAERYWDQARWAIAACAWRFDGLERAPRAGGTA